MTKDKITIDKVGIAACILAGLLLGAFLGSPVPDQWAEYITNSFSAASQAQAVETVNLHNGAADKAKTNNEAKDDFCETTENSESNTGSATDSGIKLVVSEAPAGETPPDYISYNVNRSGAANRKEKDVLIHLINAEAYGLSYKAKLAVGQVVINRWKGPYYGDDLLAIMTAPHQFTPIYNGSAYEKEIEPDSVEAANAVLNGAGLKELTDDTYYFVNPDFTEDKTIENQMQFVYEIEGIHFYKPPTV